MVPRGHERGRYKGQHAQGVMRMAGSCRVMRAGRLRPGRWARDGLGP